jgi:hypothetical protein
MTGSNQENQELDETPSANDNMLEVKEEDEVGLDGSEDDAEHEDELKETEDPYIPESNHDGGNSSSAANPSGPSTPAPSTPAATSAPGQESTARTPGQLTPGLHQIPIQPYAYPPYPYYPPVPGYAPPPTAMHHLPQQGDQMLSGSTNPYQYTDVANLGDPMPDTRRNRGGVTEPFPEKLHRMLEAAEREGVADVVSFFSHGRAFAIHKPRRFVNEIMPRFFRQTRLTSFQRQLNLYGFRRISQGPDNGGTLCVVNTTQSM